MSVKKITFNHDRPIFIHVPKTAGRSMEAVLEPIGINCPGHYQIRFCPIKNQPSFAFVRNPWDRAVSWYLYAQREEPTIHKDTPLYEFIEKHMAFLFGSPQYNVAYLICDMWNKEPIVSFIGQFEHLERDWPQALETIGIDTDLPLGFVNISTDNRKHYTEYDWSDETIKLIRELSCWEIERFGYSF